MPAPGLEDVDPELAVHLPVGDLLRGVLDRLGATLVQRAERAVRARAGELQEGVGTDEDGRGGLPRYGEVLDRPQRLDAVVGGGGNLAWAERVGLGPVLRHPGPGSRAGQKTL